MYIATLTGLSSYRLSDLISDRHFVSKHTGSLSYKPYVHNIYIWGSKTGAFKSSLSLEKISYLFDEAGWFETVIPYLAPTLFQRNDACV
jgi:hypothetical protein